MQREKLLFVLLLFLFSVLSCEGNDNPLPKEKDDDGKPKEEQPVPPVTGLAAEATHKVNELNITWNNPDGITSVEITYWLEGDEEKNAETANVRVYNNGKSSYLAQLLGYGTYVVGAVSIDNYGKRSEKVTVTAVPADNDDPFKGKNLATFGNSITAAENSWAYQVYRKLEFGHLYNGAVGGAIWSKRVRTTQDGNTIRTQNYDDPDFVGMSNEANNSPEAFQRIINNCAIVHIQKYLSQKSTEPDPDYIILSYGTNDVLGKNEPDPETVLQQELEDVDQVSLGGGIRWCIETLRTEFPDAKLYVAFPIQAKSANRNADNLKKIAIIKKICEGLSVTYFDSYAESGITQENESQFLRDGLHPNENGKVIHGDYIITKMKETNES